MSTIDRTKTRALLVPGQRGGLVADALLDVAVRAEHVDVMVERAGAGGRIRVQKAALTALGHGHADRVGDALAERTGRGLDSGNQVVFGMARRLAAELAEVTDIVERNRGLPQPLILGVDGARAG